MSLKTALFALSLSAFLAQGVSQAYAPEDDLLKIKGYSPELIRMTDTQRSRQEWREPQAPVRTPVENAFHNIFYNNWTGSFDEFGSNIIRSY